MSFYINYGIHKATWKNIQNEVEEKGKTSREIKKEFDLDSVQVWFLFDKLLRGEYSHLYKRDPLTREDIKVGQFVFCDYPEYGRGEIIAVFERPLEMPKAAKLMDVKFESRSYSTFCDYEKMTTVHDNTKRKITKL